MSVIDRPPTHALPANLVIRIIKVLEGYRVEIPVGTAADNAQWATFQGPDAIKSVQRYVAVYLAGLSQ